MAGRDRPQRRVATQRNTRPESQIDPQIIENHDFLMPPPASRSTRSRGTRDPEELKPRLSRRGPPENTRAPSSELLDDAVSEYTDPPESQYHANKARELGGSDLAVHRAIPRSSVVSSQADGTSPIKPETLRKLLKRLVSSAEILVGFLGESSFEPNQDDTEGWLEEFEVCDMAFNTFRQPYVSFLSNPFINMNFVLDKMAIDERSDAWRLASQDIAAANFATFLADTIRFNRMKDDRTRLNTLEQWNAAFPADFLPASDHLNVPSDILLMKTAGIRSHIILLESEVFNETNRMDKICELFFEDATADKLHRYCQEEHFDLVYKDIPGVPMDDWTNSRLRIIIQALCRDENWKTESNDIFPLATLLEGIKDLALHCFRILSGSTHVSHAEMDHASRDQRQISSQSKSEADPQSQANSIGPSVEDIRALEEVARETRDRLGTEDAIINQALAMQSSGFTGVPNPTFSSQEGFVPPQPSDYQHPSGPVFAESAMAALKRSLSIDEEDAFETDKRVPDIKRRKVSKPRKKRIVAAANASPAVRESSEMGQPIVSSAHNMPNAPIYPAPPGSDMDLGALSQRAREISAAHRKPKQPQTRTPWSRNDCKTLVRAVDNWQCKWAQIEEAIKTGALMFEHPRDQQALRDKARLIKLDYLKTDSVLPPSFDLVVLGKKEKNAVMACGRNPDRKEDEVDENGVPYNTLWPGEMGQGAADALPGPQAHPEPQLEPHQPSPEEQARLLAQSAVNAAPHLDPESQQGPVMQPVTNVQPEMALDPDLQDPEMAKRIATNASA